jgi:radical SAM protein with 4Fe4S-binding SPASM domain
MWFKEFALKIQTRFPRPSRSPGVSSPAEEDRLSPEQTCLARSYLEGKTELAVGPKYLVLELTNHCNLSCVMCPRRQMTRATGFMDPALFRRIIEEAAPSVEMIYLHFMGEPLLHDKFPEFIRFASGRGMTVAMATNSTLLTDARLDALLQSRLDALLVSFDGGSPAVFERIRRGADFSSVHRQLIRLLRKIELDAPDFNHVIQFIRMPPNSQDLDPFLTLWKALPQARVKIKDLHDFGNQLEELRRWKHGDGVPSLPGGRVCYEPWRGFVVGWDGRVFPCCNDYDGKTVLGDLREESLASLWSGERMRRFRAAHRRGRRGDFSLCRNCSPPFVSQPGALQMFSPFSPSAFELQSYFNRGLLPSDPGSGETAYFLSGNSEVFVQDRTGEIRLALESADSNAGLHFLDLFLYGRLLAHNRILKKERKEILLKVPAEFRGRLLRLNLQQRATAEGNNQAPASQIRLRLLRNW